MIQFIVDKNWSSLDFFSKAWLYSQKLAALLGVCSLLFWHEYRPEDHKLFKSPLCIQEIQEIKWFIIWSLYLVLQGTWKTLNDSIFTIVFCIRSKFLAIVQSFYKNRIFVTFFFVQVCWLWALLNSWLNYGFEVLWQNKTKSTLRLILWKSFRITPLWTYRIYIFHRATFIKNIHSLKLFGKRFSGKDLFYVFVPQKLVVCAFWAAVKF